MEIRDNQLYRFKEIYKDYYGYELSDRHARKYAKTMVYAFKPILLPLLDQLIKEQNGNINK